MATIGKRSAQIRRSHQLRKVPALDFFKDDTLDEVFRLEEIFRELNEENEAHDESAGKGPKEVD